MSDLVKGYDPDKDRLGTHRGLRTKETRSMQGINRPTSGAMSRYRGRVKTDRSFLEMLLQIGGLIDRMVHGKTAENAPEYISQQSKRNPQYKGYEPRTLHGEPPERYRTSGGYRR